jgi:OOP family OmpA-OmpF porin
MKRIVAAGLFALATIAGSALAQQQPSGWYGGISAGQSSADVDASGLTVLGATASSTSVEDTDTGFKVYGGYRFNRNLAVEAGWADLGAFSATRRVTAPATGSIKAETKVSGLFGQVVGIIPVAERFSVFGTAGLYANEVKTTISTSGAVVPLGATSASNSDANLKVGVGAGYDFTDKFGVRVEWERFFDLGDDSVGGKSDVDFVSIGLVIRF